MKCFELNQLYKAVCITKEHFYNCEEVLDKLGE